MNKMKSFITLSGKTVKNWLHLKNDFILGLTTTLIRPYGCNRKSRSFSSYAFTWLHRHFSLWLSLILANVFSLRQDRPLSFTLSFLKKSNDALAVKELKGTALSGLNTISYQQHWRPEGLSCGHIRIIFSKPRRPKLKYTVLWWTLI